MSHSNPPHHRRAHERVRLSLEVAYRSTGSFLVSYSVDLSRGGLFVETDRPLPVSTELDLRLAVPGIGEQVSLRGRVVWVQDRPAPGKPVGMGIQFQHVEERLASLIDSLVRHFRGLHVLLACPDHRLRYRLERMLRRSLTAKYDVTALGAEDEPVQVAEYDLIVVDLGQGDDAALALVEAAQARAALVVLASQPRWRSVAREMGVQEVVASPPPLAELRAAVLRAVGRPLGLRGFEQEKE